LLYVTYRAANGNKHNKTKMNRRHCVGGQTFTRYIDVYSKLFTNGIYSCRHENTDSWCIRHTASKQRTDLMNNRLLAKFSIGLNTKFS